jgi:hypothetical protein
MDESLVEAIRRRAGYACEYCHLPEEFHPGPFEVEHIIARQHGGLSVPRNLAWSCLQCNRHKGSNLVGIDGKSSRLVRLFNPRFHKWSFHFRWDGPYLKGRTPIGRVTVDLLAINAPLRVALREYLIAEGVLPL